MAVVHSKSAELASLNQLLAGLQKHFPSTTFNVQGSPQTTTQIVGVLQGRAVAAQGVITAKAGYHSAVTASDLLDGQTDAYWHDVRQAILLASQAADVLADCGLSPPKKRSPLTSQQEVVRAAKAKATRIARGTMSAKQKALIKGSVPGTLTVPTGDSGSGASPPASPPATTGPSNGSSTPHA